MAAEPGRGRRAGTATAGWWDALDRQAADGAFWLLLDLEQPHGDVAPRALRPGTGPPRARALGLDDNPGNAR